MKRTLLIGLLITGLVLTAVAPVFAHGDENHEEQRAQALEQRAQALEAQKQTLQEQLEKRQQQLSGRQAKRCEFVKAKLQFHRDRAAQIRQHRSERYQMVIDRLDALADRLDAQDIDSSGLRLAIQKLTAMVSGFEGTFTTFESELQAAIVQVCDDGQITKEELAQLRTLVVRLRRNADTVHGFIRSDLKPALDTVKTEVKEARQEAAQTKPTDSPPTEEIDHTPPPAPEAPDSDPSTISN